MLIEYTACTIQWDDSGVEQNVIISSEMDFDPNADGYDGRLPDEEVFFYGLSFDEIEELYESGELCEGEWRIIDVGPTMLITM